MNEDKLNCSPEISIQSILIDVGFLPFEYGLQYDFGNCKLQAVRGLNQYFENVYNFFGFYRSERRAGELEFFIPLHVESYEQGLAFIAYYLRNADLKNRPDWLETGLALTDHLPWERNLKELRENPTATIEHEWFRVLVNKLRLPSSNSNDEDITTFSFYGEILKVVCNNETLVISGSGKDWKRTAIVETKSLDLLPKKIPKSDISIYIWKDILHIGGRGFSMQI